MYILMKVVIFCKDCVNNFFEERKYFYQNVKNYGILYMFLEQRNFIGQKKYQRIYFGKFNQRKRRFRFKIFRELEINSNDCAEKTEDFCDQF